MDGNELALGMQTVAVGAKDRFKPESSIEDRARVCFECAFDENYAWFVRANDDDLRFRIAVGALMLHATPEEKVRIERTLDLARAVNVAASGVPVDWEAMLDESQPQPLPLQKIYFDVRDCRARSNRG